MNNSPTAFDTQRIKQKYTFLNDEEINAFISCHSWLKEEKEESIIDEFLEKYFEGLFMRYKFIMDAMKAMKNPPDQQKGESSTDEPTTAEIVTVKKEQFEDEMNTFMGNLEALYLEIFEKRNLKSEFSDMIKLLEENVEKVLEDPQNDSNKKITISNPLYRDDTLVILLNSVGYNVSFVDDQKLVLVMDGKPNEDFLKMVVDTVSVLYLRNEKFLEAVCMHVAAKFEAQAQQRRSQGNGGSDMVFNWPEKPQQQQIQNGNQQNNVQSSQQNIQQFQQNQQQQPQKPIQQQQQPQLIQNQQQPIPQGNSRSNFFAQMHEKRLAGNMTKNAQSLNNRNLKSYDISQNGQQQQQTTTTEQNVQKDDPWQFSRKYDYQQSQKQFRDQLTDYRQAMRERFSTQKNTKQVFVPNMNGTQNKYQPPKYEDIKFDDDDDDEKKPLKREPRTVTMREIEMKRIEEDKIAFAKRCLELTNEFRKKNNMSPLVWNQQLYEIGMVHSQDMAEGRVPFGHHNFQQRVSKITFGYQSVSENVAFNQNCPDPAGAAVNGWINSPGHRKNLLSVSTDCAISCYRALNGSWYFTQLFALKFT